MAMFCHFTQVNVREAFLLLLTWGHKERIFMGQVMIIPLFKNGSHRPGALRIATAGKA